MAEAIEWFKAASTSIKDNKWLVIWIVSALAGLGGNIIQSVNAETKTKELRNAKAQIVGVATSCYKSHTKEPVAPKPKPKSRTIIVKETCVKCINQTKSECAKQIKDHVRIHH
jgi:hypothetical protein